MKNYLKIIVAGSTGIIITKLMGLGSFTLLGFAVFMLAFLSVSFVWLLIEQKINFNFKKITIGLVASLLIVLSFAYFFLWQYQNTTPITNAVLDKNRTLYKLYAGVFQFHPNMSNAAYRSLRYRFTEYLIPFQLNSEEKQQIWQNYLKLFVLQTKIRNLLIDIKVDVLGNNISYGYEFDYGQAKVTPFSINSFITTFNNHEEGASIPSAFFKKPRKKPTFKDFGGIVKANLPYFNNSIPINKKDINKVKLIHKMTQISAQILVINKQLTLNKH